MIRPRLIEILDPVLGLKNGNRIFTSLEGENPGGSMKDHMVVGEIESLLANKILVPGGGIAEVSAGSTAVSLAHYCPRYGLKCVLFVPTSVPASLVESLRAMGAEVHQEELSSIYQKFDLFMNQRPGLVRFDQLFDQKKRRHYHGFGKYAASMLNPLHAVIGAVGTGHSLIGISEGMHNAAEVITAEPDSFKVPGVRNLTVDRYGEQDRLTAEDFAKRQIIKQSDLFGLSTVETSVGPIELTPSFALVLAGAKAFLRGERQKRVFAVGSNSKLVKTARWPQAA